MEHQHPQAPLRPPSTVMRLKRMGAFFPTRISFMRSLIRDLHQDSASVTRPVWTIDAEGYGRAVYTVRFLGHDYSLIAFSQALAPEDRTDRVIAEAWDAAFTLFDGVPTEEDIDRLAGQTPKQEAGRFSAKDFVLSRANKSLRLFEHVASRLAEGRQPDAAFVNEVGYLMRTTAVYGNGKFGVADRFEFADRPGMDGPFRAEMLTVWLIRGFTHDLVEHVAKARNPEAATLAPEIKRHLGIGNATGLGMAPFLVNHPVLLNSWMLARETALARVLTIETPTEAEIASYKAIVARALAHLAEWRVADEAADARIRALEAGLSELAAAPLASNAPWAALMKAAAAVSADLEELIAAILIEPHGDLVDGLAHCMATDAEPRLTPNLTCGELLDAMEHRFDWALGVDFEDKEQSRRFWYVSEEKLEPRIGDRYEEQGAHLEDPLDIARQAQALAEALTAEEPATPVSEFLKSRPALRRVAKRAASAEWAPYAEIQDNLIAADCLPIDMLRCKLSFFGATKFDPKSDLWTRVTLYQGAPTMDEIGAPGTDDWAFPTLPQ